MGSVAYDHMSLDKKKYQQAILYLCQALGGRIKGKKKLAKLLYFVDFDLYEKHEKSLTGDIYKALPMGPFPSDLESVLKEMKQAKLLSVETVEEYQGYVPTEMYTCLQDPDISIFDEKEKAMLDRIVAQYGHLTGKQLEELSHAEAPYIGTAPTKEIPYELAFYRGTDFSEV